MNKLNLIALVMGATFFGPPVSFGLLEDSCSACEATMSVEGSGLPGDVTFVVTLVNATPGTCELNSGSCDPVTKCGFNATWVVNNQSSDDYSMDTYTIDLENGNVLSNVPNTIPAGTSEEGGGWTFVHCNTEVRYALRNLTVPGYLKTFKLTCANCKLQSGES